MLQTEVIRTNKRMNICFMTKNIYYSVIAFVCMYVHNTIQYVAAAGGSQ